MGKKNAKKDVKVAEVVNEAEVTQPIEVNPVELKSTAATMAATIRKANKIKKEGDSILSGLYNKAEARKTKLANKADVPTDKQVKTYQEKITAMSPDYEEAQRIVSEHEAKVKATKAELGIKDRKPRQVTFSAVRGQVIRRSALRTALGKKGFDLHPDSALMGPYMVEFLEDGWQMRDVTSERFLIPKQEYGAGSMKLIKDIIG